jgi:hypothetical protein
MLKKSHIAAVIAAAALVSAAPASALPIDQVILDTADHEFQFGDQGSCSPGAAPSAPAVLDWNESANGQSVRPAIEGDLCLQDTNAEARVAVVYHTASGQTITKFSSPSLTGSGGPLTTSYVNQIGSRVSKSILHHVHLRVEQPDPAGGWDTVTEAVLYP